jgi:GTPase SAR1 family protein
MGNCLGGGNAATDTNSHANAQKQVKDRQKEMQKEIKLLLLGSGESGKSTFFKQVKIIHNNGFSAEELNQYRSSIYCNILQTIRALSESIIKQSIPFENEENLARAKRIIELAESDTSLLLNASQKYTPQVADDVEALWNDKAMKQMFERRYDYHVFDGAQYFFANLERIRPPNFTPTAEDILRCRRKTTGIIEISFNYKGFTFKLFDVGGQRNERKKWIHCFESVSAVIFVASLSDYDQKCYEDDVTNRMMESLDLFDEIVNGNWFKNTTIMLFLNKTDVFREKIKKTDLKVCFDEYDGGCDYEKAASM